MAWFTTNWLRVLVHGSGAGSLLWLVAVYMFGLAPLPDRAVMLQSGTYGLIFLIAALACTPIRRWIFPPVIHVRRALGLYGVAHCCIHLAVYAIAENGLSLELILRDLEERRAMPIGLVALVLLIPLAITSTSGWQRRLGRRWKQLHRLFYLAMPLAVWHYLWLDRDLLTAPIVYGLIVALLLLLRLIPPARPSHPSRSSQ
ncbi:MAG: ferric reductase-like transmembrane domain-containing protein [Roseiflexaceae bacterium]